MYRVRFDGVDLHVFTGGVGEPAATAPTWYATILNYLEVKELTK